MEPAEASTGVDEDDEHLPNTLKESLASIEAEVEHAANLEPSKSGCLAAVCEKLQNAAVEGVPARGDVHQQFRRDFKEESLTAKYEQQCQNRQAQDLYRKQWASNRVKVQTTFSKRDRLLERDVSTTGSGCCRGGQTANNTEAAARICRKCAELGSP